VSCTLTVTDELYLDVKRIYPENKEVSVGVFVLSCILTFINSQQIEPVNFMVSVYDEEPNEAFTDEPTPAVVDTHLDPTTSTCHCIPKARDEIVLLGDENKNKENKVHPSVTEAVTKKNNLEDQDILVVLESLDPEGNDTKVAYTVQCVKSACVVEELLPPDLPTLNETLGKNGLALAQQQPEIVTLKPDVEDEDGNKVGISLF